MSLYIVGKKPTHVKQVVIGQPAQASNNMLYVNERKLVKAANESGTIHAYHPTSNSHVVSVGRNAAKEQQKFIYIQSRHETAVAETQAPPRERFFCQIIKSQNVNQQLSQELVQKQEEQDRKAAEELLEEDRRREEQRIKDEEARREEVRRQEEQAEEQRRKEEETQRKMEELRRQQENRNQRIDTSYNMILQGQYDKQNKGPDPLEQLINSKVDLFLHANAPRKQYYSRPWEEKEDIRHWGQRKLLLVEIYFLTTYGHLSRNVVYAGAAPGMHIQYLSNLFPNHNFHLYDPNEIKVKATEHVHIYQSYFTEKEANVYKNQFKGDCLFVSDVRAANYKEMTPLENENQILQENNQQMYWVEIMRPKKSMLKFRCAYPTVIVYPTLFFKGDILIQPWAPQSSTETRLIPHDQLEKKEYDNKVYEEQLFHHNDTVRKEFYIEMNSSTEGLDGTWDACAEWYILSLYVKQFYQPLRKSLNAVVSKLSRKITKRIQWENGKRLLSDRKKQKADEPPKEPKVIRLSNKFYCV